MLRLKQLVFLMAWFPAFALGGTGPDVPDYPTDRVAHTTSDIMVEEELGKNISLTYLQIEETE
jgi:hypothetical protein